MTILTLSAAVLASALGAGPLPSPICESGAQVLEADLATSTIKWKGTKYWGLRSHEGTVALHSGTVCVRNNRIVRAHFVADMRTIDVTDIPAHDPVPRRNLRNHLLGEDFFHVAEHPEAQLTILRVEPENRSLSLVHARLEMRGVTHDIRFFARISRLSSNEIVAEARFAIDRQRWGIRYLRSALREDLVDDEFWLDLRLRATAPER
ncbi:MAG: YceI family protein [Gemmatimonadales bacterium]|nr:YceI family protein [Gemmatimonadales bacterium]MDZ4390283.1 YceI family protein [Gemmatimonadales bacterium]